MSGVTKVPEDAFAFFVALGSGRTYDEVAKRYQVSKRTVTRAAAREKWTERLVGIEERTRQLTDERLVDTLHERDMRHRRIVMAMAARAAKALQTHELTSCMEGAKVAELAIKLERLISSQPAEAMTISVEKATRDELARFLTTDANGGWDDEEDDDTGGDANDEAGGDESLPALTE